MVEPNAQVALPKPGDHGLFVDDDGAAYIVYTSIELGHAIAVERLSPDWLAGSGQTSDFLDRGCEAPTMFKHHGTYYVLLGNTCCFCPQGADVRVFTAASPLGPYTLRGEINRDATGGLIIPAQQTHVATIPTVNGPELLWMGDCWGSRPDGIKGHDLQYWSSPLRFEEDGTINQLTFTKEFELVLP